MKIQRYNPSLMHIGCMEESDCGQYVDISDVENDPMLAWFMVLIAGNAMLDIIHNCKECAKHNATDQAIKQWEEATK